MQAIVLVFLTAFSFHSASAQFNVLLLRKKNKTIKQFFVGHYITIETVNKSFAEGIISRITHDSIYIQHFDIQESVSDYGGVYFDTAFRFTTAIHYTEIGKVL